MLKRDLLAGLILLVFSLGYLSMAIELPQGSLGRMGPGLFPFGLGLLTLFFGASIFFKSFFQDIKIGTFPIRPLIAIFSGIAAFAILIQTYGLFPAEIATVFLCSQAVEKPNLKHILLICAALLLITWLVFIVLLEMLIPLFIWTL
jgi:hypothetical protein